MNKAFIRSVEAVMAILLFFSFYSINTQSYGNEAAYSDPSRQILGLMEALDNNDAVTGYIESHDLKGLSDIISYFLPPLSGFKIESTCIEMLEVENKNNYETQANISFVKFLPNLANTKSIEIMDSFNNFMQASVKNNYYVSELSINFENELINQTIILDNIRITVDASESINSSAMRFFLGSEPAIMRLESIIYNSEPYDANVSIKVLVPYAKGGSVAKAFLFYPVNETGFTVSYPQLTGGITVDYYASPAVKSRACEITFQDSLDSNEKKKYGLYYELNTNTQREYSELESNYSNIEIIHENKYYASNENIKTYEAQSYYSVKSSYVFGIKNCMINLKVWNYE